MELRVIKVTTNNSYRVTLKTTMNDTETAKVARFGPPTVEIGGTFDGGTFDDFTLPTQQKRIPSEFPVVQSFDGTELGQDVAKTRANIWANEMKIRVQNSITEFKALPDDFDDDRVYTV